MLLRFKDVARQASLALAAYFDSRDASMCAAVLKFSPYSLSFDNNIINSDSAHFHSIRLHLLSFLHSNILCLPCRIPASSKLTAFLLPRTNALAVLVRRYLTVNVISRSVRVRINLSARSHPALLPRPWNANLNSRSWTQRILSILSV